MPLALILPRGDQLYLCVCVCACFFVFLLELNITAQFDPVILLIVFLCYSINIHCDMMCHWSSKGGGRLRSPTGITQYRIIISVSTRDITANGQQPNLCLPLLMFCLFCCFCSEGWGGRGSLSSVFLDSCVLYNVLCSESVSNR